MVITLFLTGGGQEEWANSHGLTHPVLDDSSYDVIGRFISGSFNIPNVQILSPGMKVEVTQASGVSASQFEAWLPR